MTQDTRESVQAAADKASGIFLAACVFGGAVIVAALIVAF